MKTTAIDPATAEAVANVLLDEASGFIQDASEANSYSEKHAYKRAARRLREAAFKIRQQAKERDGGY